MRSNRNVSRRRNVSRKRKTRNVSKRRNRKIVRGAGTVQIAWKGGEPPAPTLGEPSPRRQNDDSFIEKVIEEMFKNVKFQNLIDNDNGGEIDPSKFDPDIIEIIEFFLIQS